MAEEHAGQRQGGLLAAPWTKIFAAFRVAIDPQKLFLAAVGILAMALGWWLLAVVFYSPDMPVPTAKTEQEWKSFQYDRKAWNLLHEMAGYDKKTVDIADVASSLDEYKQLEAIQDAVGRFGKTVTVTSDEFKIGDTRYEFNVDSADKKKLKDVEVRQLRVVSVTEDKGEAGKPVLVTVEKVELGGVPVVLVNSKQLADLNKYLQGARLLSDLRFEYQAVKDVDERAFKLGMLDLYEAKLLNPATKLYGRLRVWPWDQDRGPNPYLVVNRAVTNKLTAEETTWFFSSQPGVLLEPLYKFLAPIFYWFSPTGGFVNRIYLFFVILWMVIIWGVIGGAITRMAIVQLARNEKVGPAEAIRFVRARIQSYVTAPLFPLVFLAGLAIFLFFFGLFEQIPLLGDIFVAGLFWPVVLIFGLIMAVVLIGLIGWPLMYATLSAEGSDSFDAISRSYSYVFQATWNYLMYGLLALLYGAVLVFFVGFLSSLMVYMGKWGVSNGNLWQSREPSYLFMYAPTSFGWRDLLMDKNVHSVRDVSESGRIVYHNVLNETYAKDLTWYNKLGAVLVTFWLSIFFMLVVGFGYSYFWTASSIIYLLMRQKVDDTEFDEIHMEDEEDDFTPPAYVPAEGKPAETKPAPAGPNVTMVEAPTLRAAPASTAPPPSSSPPASSSPPPASTTPPAATPAAEPVRTAPKTMLAPPDEDPHQPPDNDAHKHGDDV